MDSPAAGTASSSLPPATLRARCWLIAAVGLIGLVTVLALPAIPQDQAYHDFADHRARLGVPNWGDVLSNAAFIVVGAAGVAWLLWLPDARRVFTAAWERLAYLLLFGAEILVGLGSAYYHWAPSDQRLIWDRLPLTMLLATLVAIVLAERTTVRAGRLALPLLQTAFIASVLVWHIGNLHGTGDLRLYGFMQLYAMLATALLVALLPSRFNDGRWWWAVCGGYALAKLCELLDRPILAVLGCISGHTIKHLVAAAATLVILGILMRRRVRCCS